MKKSKVPVSAPPAGLQSPFAGLEMAGLPEGPAETPVDESPSAYGRVVLRREKSGRGGKTVIVVSDFDPRVTIERIEELARSARQHCGCGGTVHGREIELQGDNAPKVREFFLRAGFRVAGVS
ncbi:MAG: translation initiation factor [Terrimicrobiaceae bacterium]|nr:translation initiation factor [Terrimicrobiaceae bacterium]